MADAALLSLQHAAEALRQFMAQPDLPARLDAIADHLAAVLRKGGKILAVGNGGSCADAMHFCEELTGRFRADRPPLAAIACTDPGHMTCTANDYGYDQVFARWITALAREGDAVVLLSTSGNSPNIVEALKAAKHAHASTVALLGKTGGLLKGACTHELIAPGATADRIQELHMLALHILVELIEAKVAAR